MTKKKHRDIPVYNLPIIETHCHLDYLDEQDLPSVLAQANHVGVERIVTIAVSPDNLDTVRQLARNHDTVWGTQGIHPHEAGQFDSTVETALRAGLADQRMVAVGEIGLDYHYDYADRATQRSVFERQLELAAELDVAVVIHSREADADTRDILHNCTGRLVRGGVIHSFTASIALAEFCLDAGFHLGFNGIVTFNNANEVRDAVRATPLDRLLLETDAPYLTPVPYRGRPNAPYYLPFVAEKIAEIKSVDIEHLLQTVFRNSLAVFFPEDAATPPTNPPLLDGYK